MINPIPEDLPALHSDDCYDTAQAGADGRQDSKDYAYTAEYNVGWAAALVELLRPHGGRVLDFGCADGHLLGKLGPGYTRFGIEVDAAASRLAAERGVVMLGRDVEDPVLIERYRGSFDIVTAIGVFQRLRDIRSAMHTTLRLLRPDGVLLFEVPLMSAIHDNTLWLTSSFGQVWFPDELSLQRLVQTELGAQMVGAELSITGHASTYIGLVFGEAADGRAVRELASRVLLRTSDTASADEAVARMLLHLVHAATASGPDVGALASLPMASLNRQLMRRFVSLWQTDLTRLQSARSERAKAEARASRLKADLRAAQADRVSNNTELTTALVAAQERLAAAEADLAARILAEPDLAQHKAGLGRQTAVFALQGAATEAALAQHRAASEMALQEALALRAHPAWRVATILAEAARRYPQLARQVGRVSRVLWWTVRGRLISRLRFRQQVRAQLRAASHVEQPKSETPLAPPQPAVGQSLAVHGVTGHWPALMDSRERPGDWPLVSVVVTSFNGQFVAEAVDSVLAQTFKDLEVIVVEGGSSNPTSRLLAAGLQRPRTRVLMQGARHRVGATRNFGIGQARGRYVCCLHADDTLAPTYIEKAVFLLERHGHDVVSGAMQMIGIDGDQMILMEQPDLEHILADNQVLTCAVFRRSYWQQAGGYLHADSTVAGDVYEDWAFWVRLAALGARFRNLHHDTVLRHRVHPTSLSRDADVAPMVRQRDMVRQINQDVLEPISERIALSRQQASIRYGTPSTAPAPVILDRDPPDRQPPTLLLALPFLIPGDTERLLGAVIAFLVQDGWTVVITTTTDAGSEQGDTTSWFAAETCEIFQLPHFLPTELWQDFVHHLVGSRNVDVVWVVGSAFIYDSLRSLRAAYPRLRVADLLFNTVNHTTNNRRRRDLIDLIFVDNNEVRDWLLARGEDASRVCLVETGVDLVALRPLGRSETLARRIAYSPGDLIVGFSGRWSEEDNPLGFVAIARLVDPILPVRFVMTGAGHQRPAIEDAVREAQFANRRFHLVNALPDIVPVLASYDLLVIPSVMDERPVVALEALAMGVPVLASRIGALQHTIQEGKTGWLCESGDLTAFAKWIEHANGNRTALQDMRQHARAYAEANLDVRTMLTKYGTRLASLLPKDRQVG